VLTYRAHDSSVEKVKASLQRTADRLFGSEALQPRTDA
jgi:hypothetical protein